VDFRRKDREHGPITIDGASVESVNIFKFLAVHVHEEHGGQMAEQLGNRAFNQKVAGSIPGRAK